jgi:hypothetical protein
MEDGKVAVLVSAKMMMMLMILTELDRKAIERALARYWDRGEGETAIVWRALDLLRSGKASMQLRAHAMTMTAEAAKLFERARQDYERATP